VAVAAAAMTMDIELLERVKGSRCPRGGELGYSKNQQQLNPKQELNFTQLLAIREYY
jgi:CxxC motif-containing protein